MTPRIVMHPESIADTDTMPSGVVRDMPSCPMWCLQQIGDEVDVAPPCPWSQCNGRPEGLGPTQIVLIRFADGGQKVLAATNWLGGVCDDCGDEDIDMNGTRLVTGWLVLNVVPLWGT